MIHQPSGDLAVHGSDGQQLTIPGHLWPAGLHVGNSDPIFFAPITKRQANEFLELWKHPLGAYQRPFGYQAWGLAFKGEAAAIVISGSTVSATVNGHGRKEVVELARIARHPQHPGIMRVMLRLWRDYLAPEWPHWPVKTAVSYALPGKAGNLYRFDGWHKIGQVKPSGGGGTWSNKPKPATIADGRKTLYTYDYSPTTPRDRY